MNIWKRFLTALTLACLIVNTVPVAGATAADADARKGLDYSELELQVAIANGLESYEYTKQSWDKLQEVLEIGKTRLAGIYDQGKLDSAAEDIANALSMLVKMDYSALNKALNTVEAIISANPELHDVWYRLDKATDQAKQLLISGDQEAVNAAVEELDTLMDELAECSPVAGEPEVVIQEVEVEVLPTDDFCNIPKHHTWPVLFGISALLNVVLIAALIYVLVKKRETTDNTPLVNYDIEDDMDF